MRLKQKKRTLKKHTRDENVPLGGMTNPRDTREKREKKNPDDNTPHISLTTG